MEEDSGSLLELIMGHGAEPRDWPAVIPQFFYAVAVQQFSVLVTKFCLT